MLPNTSSDKTPWKCSGLSSPTDVLFGGTFFITHYVIVVMMSHRWGRLFCGSIVILCHKYVYIRGNMFLIRVWESIRHPRIPTGPCHTVIILCTRKKIIVNYGIKLNKLLSKILSKWINYTLYFLYCFLMTLLWLYLFLTAMSRIV